MHPPYVQIHLHRDYYRPFIILELLFTKFICKIFYVFHFNEYIFIGIWFCLIWCGVLRSLKNMLFLCNKIDIILLNNVNDFLFHGFFLSIICIGQ